MDMPIAKRRPALVVSVRNFNEVNDHSLMVMITSAKSSQWPSDYQLQEQGLAGLKRECFVGWKVFMLPNAMIAKKIGALTPKDSGLLQAQLRGML